jgi:L-threonylcarbamoyladenylate synthase
MRILKITKQSVAEAVGILKVGGTVVYPTETAYALGADITDAKAIAKIFKIKNRPSEKNLPAICATKKQAKEFFEMPVAAWRIWKKYFPKPVSIVLSARHCEESRACRGATRQSHEKRDCFASLAMISHSIPVRISSNKVARSLARELGRPVAATSANISGQPAIYNIEDIIAGFSKRKYQPDIVLDAGTIPQRLPSTIIKIANGKIEVLRQGEVKIVIKTIKQESRNDKSINR